METFLIVAILLVGAVNTLNVLTASSNESETVQVWRGRVLAACLLVMIVLMIYGEISGVIHHYDGNETPP